VSYTHVLGEPCFPSDLKEHYVSLKEIGWFAEECKKMGLAYIGLCCGNDATYMRALSKSFGRSCAAARLVNVSI